MPTEGADTGAATGTAGETATGPAADLVRAQLDLARARTAARHGEHAEAVRLLEGLDAAGAAGTEALDLLARVHAQQGDLDAADACWARVQEADPGDRAAADGRRTIAEIRAGRRRRRPVLRPALLLLGVVVLVVALSAGVVTWVRSEGGAARREAAAAARTQAETSRLRQDNARLTGRLEAAHRRAARVRRHEAARRHAAVRLARRLAGPGVRVHPAGRTVEVRFTAGVFTEDTALSPSGRAALTRLGGRLGREDVTTTVVGHTVAVPGGPRRGGSTVAYDRARVAAAVLAAASHRPLTSFALASADQRHGPYDDPARNRTVTLVVRPAGR